MGRVIDCIKPALLINYIECYSYFKDILYYLSILINGVENPIM